MAVYAKGIGCQQKVHVDHAIGGSHPTSETWGHLVIIKPLVDHVGMVMIALSDPSKIEEENIFQK